ncbi:hypothetical protein LMH73_026305 [Vibrio splendidus]|nr:hypothetical protein [Vibrio splendidus]MCC4880424.1 hypothetical protein [Vibrio splendidus]
MDTPTNSQIADAVKNRKISDILINDAKLKFSVKPSIKSDEGFRLDVSINMSKSSPEIQHILHEALSSRRSFQPFLTANNGTKLDSFTISSEFLGFSFSDEPDANSYTYNDLKNPEIQRKFYNQFAKTQLVEPLKESIINCLNKESMLELDISNTRIQRSEDSPSIKEKISSYIAKIMSPTNKPASSELSM